ncbi:MAG: FG-GAP repeat protein, partial [Candidatus Gracilibacteria bacterium]|nr:FG-GAP repeat protein [Candidatus Gracilibacteria bacterium]
TAASTGWYLTDASPLFTENTTVNSQTAIAKLRGKDLSAVINKSIATGGNSRFIIDEGFASERRISVDSASENAVEKIKSLATDLSDTLHTLRIVNLDAKELAISALQANGHKPVLRLAASSEIVYEPPVSDLKPEEIPEEVLAKPLSEDAATIPFTTEANYIQEDFKQTCTKFVVDTANTSGHFTDTAGTTQTIGVGNTCSRILAGTRFQIGATWFTITAITGDGSASNGVTFTGTKSTGNYDVNFVYATKVADGVVKLNDTLSVSEMQKLVASAAAASNYLGYSVSISEDGKTAVVGLGDLAISAAYVYKNISGAWTQTQKLTASDGASADYFGRSVFISADGLTILIGASGDDVTYTDQGSVYVFTYNGSTWSQTQKLVASDAAASDGFGISASISDDNSTILIGSIYSSPLGTYSGSAYIFTKSGSTWVQTQKLTASDGVARDYFGHRVALSSDASTIVVASGYSPNNTQKGYVYIFTKSGSTWVQAQKIIASDGEDGDFFGLVDLSADGSTLVVGAGQDDVAGIVNQGSAYVYNYNGSTWVQAQKLIASDGAESDLFGFAVSISNDGLTILIASSYDDDLGVNAGSAYIFSYNGTTWIQSKKITASDGAASDYLGYMAAAISGDGKTAIIGASYDDVTYTDQGSAYIFSLAASPTSLYSTVTTSTSVNSTTWAGITSAVVTETLNSANSYYSISFDGRNSFRVYNSGFRTIASNKNSDTGGTDGVWYFRDNSSTWTAAYSNTANAAISQAVAAGANNQMVKAGIEAITSAQWLADGGFSDTQVAFDLAATLYSTVAGNNPQVDNVTINPVIAATASNQVNGVAYMDSSSASVNGADIVSSASIPYTTESNYYQEDLRQTCTKFVVDTANASGHFTNTAGTTQTVGVGNTCAKIISGDRFQIGSDFFTITSITGDGSASNGVIFSGTKATGTYDVAAVYASQVASGVVKLNGGIASLYGDGTYSGNIIQGGSTLQPQSYSYFGPDIAPSAVLSQVGTTAGSYTSNYLVDGNNSTGAGLSPVSATTRYIFDFTTSKNIQRVLTSVNFGTYSIAAEVQYSDNGTDWTTAVAAFTTPLGNTYTTNDFSFGAHRYWSLKSTGAAPFQFTTISMMESFTLSNAIVITGAATVAPDATTGASVVMADNIVIDGASASLTPSTNSKGLIVYAKSGVRLLNGGKLNIDKKGKAGNFGNLTAYSLTPAALQAKVDATALAAYVALGEGAAAAVGGTTLNVLPATASSGSVMQSGGGGGGGFSGENGQGGDGGKGGPCAGGAGGAGGSATKPLPAGDYGGPGGTSYAAIYNTAGGAGDPIGSQTGGGTSATGAGGGLLMLFSPIINIMAGSIISSDGAKGGGAYAEGGGGGAGGGIVAIVTNSGGYTNSGTVRALGGDGGTDTYTTARNGGAGGAGSVNTFTTSSSSPVVGPTSLYNTTVTAASLNSNGWAGITSAVVTETLNSANSYYSVSFDGRNSFKVYNSGWRVIASNKNADTGGTEGVWYYRDNSSTWAAAYSNTANAAISQAVAAGANNQMAKAALEGISAANWLATGGFATTQTTLDVATTLYSTGAYNN